MLKMNSSTSLGSSIGARRVFNTYNNRCVFNNYTNNNTLVLPRRLVNASLVCSNSSSSEGGLANEGGSCDHSDDIEMMLESDQQLRRMIIEKGDFVNLSEILFTKNRDYLIRYNHPQLVTADQLAGKVVVLFFVGRDPYSDSYPSYGESDTYITSLIDVYNDLNGKNCFEVVFVFVGDIFDRYCIRSSLAPPLPRESEIFNDIFSRMPWTAIPFSDITSRKYLRRIFGVSTAHHIKFPIGVVVHSTGLVLQTSCEHIIDIYGSSAYPFSDQMVAFLDSEDDIAAEKPSLKTLLVSPERDYVISNKREKVPIHTLEDKVVALYFYEDGTYNPTEELKTAYEELAKNKANFEVVLIYLTDTCDSFKCTSEAVFWNKFNTMPWLAIPFKDPIYKKLKRLFDYPSTEELHEKKAPRLVIFGPHGEFIEPCGAEVLLKFGVSAYPFTRENIVKLETEKVMDLKLETLCSPTTVFIRKDGSQVQFSELAGKRIIFYFESKYWDDVECLVSFKEPKFLTMLKEVEFLKMLKERYMQMKGTDDEFEVVYILYKNNKSCYNELVADVPWFVSRISELLRGDSAFLTYFGRYYNEYEWPFLLAFGRDGMLVRRTVYPKFLHLGFPFFAGSLEDEAFYTLSRHFFSDGYWNMCYEGLLRNSFEMNSIAR